MISDAAAAPLALHNRPVLGTEAPRADLHLARGAVDVDGGPLDVRKPPCSGVPFRVADVVSGLTRPMAYIALGHRVPLTENCAFGRIELAAIDSSQGAPCTGCLEGLAVAL